MQSKTYFIFHRCKRKCLRSVPAEEIMSILQNFNETGDYVALTVVQIDNRNKMAIKFNILVSDFK